MTALPSPATATLATPQAQRPESLAAFGNSSPVAPVVLAILDGWGYRQDENHNAIQAADTPVMDALWHAYPHSLIEASGAAVGLPDDQMGNSEVGHQIGRAHV